VPFALVPLWGGFGSVTTFVVLAGTCGLAQFVVQLRFFFAYDLIAPEARKTLQLILFPILLLVIMAVGLCWIVGNLGIADDVGRAHIPVIGGSLIAPKFLPLEGFSGPELKALQVFHHETGSTPPLHFPLKCISDQVVASIQGCDG